jgi:hypothetical protein
VGDRLSSCRLLRWLLNLVDPDVHYQCISRRAAAYPAIGGIGRKSYLELEVEEDDEREE